MSTAATTGEVPGPPVAEEAAPAKLNLYLHVVGRRPDGYHLLDSLVAFASVGDRVTVAPADAPSSPSSFMVDGPFAAAVPADAGNLAMAAAVALAGALNRPPAVRVTLTKDLPVAAGLGGGSADAAAVLRGLARLWRLPPDLPLLYEVAAPLGADVPACLAGRAAFVSGIGEVLEPAPPVAGTPVVLVNPGVPLATPQVYKARQGPFSAPARFAVADGPAALAALLAERRNDLTEPARRLCPAVDAALAAIAATRGCLLARMSGSGATCFGLYPTPEAATAAAADIAEARPGWWVRAGRLV